MKARPYETCDLMHNGVCVSSPCICKSVYIAERKEKNTKPMDKATKNLIEKEAKADAELNRGNAAMSFMEDRINGYIAGATVWAEKLKQERNKAIDECIDVIFDKMIEVGPNKRFSYKECKTILESLKDQIHEPEAKTKDSQKPN